MFLIQRSDFFLLKQKLPNPQSFFFYRKQQKVEKLQRNNISCQLTTFLSSQFASFFHIFVFLKRKQPFTCDSYLKKNNKQFLTAGVILRFFRAHTHVYTRILCLQQSPPPPTDHRWVPPKGTTRASGKPPEERPPKFPVGGNFFKSPFKGPTVGSENVSQNVGPGGLCCKLWKPIIFHNSTC